MPDNTERIILEIQGDSEGAREVISELMGMLKDLGSAVKDLKSASTAGATGLSKVTKEAQGANDAAQQGSGLMGALGSAIAGINPSTIVATLGLGKLIKALADLKGEVLSVVDHAQTLEINLESLAARELVKAGEAENVEAAMDTATQAAQGMLRVLEEIGLKSPYANEQVEQTFRMAMAYGWASNQAMDLTEAMLDWSAASGKSGWEMQRISMNLGQIRSKGRIAGQELRDLAGLGINLADVLQDQLGVGVEQFNAGLKSGTYTMDDFATAVSDYVDKNFAGAAQRLSKTVQGITASFQDLKQISLRKIFKPAADLITAELAEGFERVSAWVRESGALEKAGKTLESVVARIIDLFDRLREIVGPVFQEIRSGLQDFRLFAGVKAQLQEIGANLKAIGQQVRTLLGPVFTWLGQVIRSVPWMAMLENLRDTINGILQVINDLLRAIRAILDGNAAGAVAPLQDAFVTILAMIATTLDRFVNQMAVWGWNLVVQLANGIVRAAQSVLRSAMNFVGQVVGLFLKPGSPPKEGPLSHIVEWGRGLMETFINAFKLADFGILREILSPLQQAFQDAFAAGNLSEIEYLEQFKTVRNQVAELIADFRETGEINQGMLDGISQSLGDGGQELVKYLQLQLQRQQALERLADVQKEVSEAERAGFVSADLKEKLRAAEAEAQAAEEQVNWQKELLALQRDSVDLQLRLIKALEKLAEQGGGGGGGGGVGAGAGGAGEFQVPEFASGIGEFLPPITEAGTRSNTGKEGAGPDEGTSSIFDEWKQKIQDFIDLPIEQKIITIAQKLTELTGIDFVGALEIGASKVLGAFHQVSQYLTETAIPAFQRVKASLSEKVTGAMQTVSNFIDTRLKPVWEGLTDFLENTWWPLLSSIANFLRAAFSFAVRGVIAILESKWQMLKNNLNPILEGLLKILGDIGTYLNDVMQDAVAEIKSVWEDFKNAIEGPIGAALTWFSDKVLSPIVTWLGNIDSAIQGVTRWLDKMAEKLDGIEIPTWLRGHSPPPLANWMTDIAGAAAMANAQLDGLKGALNVNLNQARLAMTGAQGFRSGIVIVDGLHFPNVRDGRDARSIRQELRNYTEEAEMRGRITGKG